METLTDALHISLVETIPVSSAVESQEDSDKNSNILVSIDMEEKTKKYKELLSKKREGDELLARAPENPETLKYLTDMGIETVKHTDEVQMYIMKETVDGKTEVFFRFKYDEEYLENRLNWQ